MNYIYTFVFLCYSHFLFSQSLKGKIVNEYNQSIEYVNIGIVGTTKGVISDEKGNFLLDISKAKPTDSLYFSHLNYHRKSLAIKDITDKNIILAEKAIELTTVVVEAKKPKIKTIKNKGVRLAGGVAEFTNSDNIFLESIGDFLVLKKEHIAKEVHIKCIKNTMQKAVFRLNFFKVEDDNKLTPLVEKPIYIDVAQTDKKIDVVENFSVRLPKGKIWAELGLVEISGNKKSKITFPVSFSGGWIRVDENFEKLPLGIGISFAIKGYEVE